MFEGFTREWIETDEAEIHLLRAGSGPPLLLLHGYPQTHVAWHKVASGLAEHFTVILPDLRGYGHSRGPDPDPEHDAYSKRAMADDMVQVMGELGYPTFALAGHDRGARVAYRLALDWPDRVTRLAVLDIIPTLEMAERTNRALAETTYHWFFLAQPAPLPEQMIANDPDYYLDWTLDSWLGDPEGIDPEARAAYHAAFRQDSVIAAACADYRAGLSSDLDHDRADRDAGRKIACPLLVLWGRDYIDGKPADFKAIWRSWADSVEGHEMDCGHFLMEEAPEKTTRALLTFLKPDKI